MASTAATLVRRIRKRDQFYKAITVLSVLAVAMGVWTLTVVLSVMSGFEADLREKIALCQAMAKSGRGIFQVVPYFPEMEQQLANIRELGEISRAAGVPCSLQPVLSSPTSPNASETIEALEAERESGAAECLAQCFVDYDHRKQFARP